MSPQYAQLILINWFNLLSGVAYTGLVELKEIIQVGISVGLF